MTEIQNLTAAREALFGLLLAYAKGERSAHVEWEELDAAYMLARDAMPGQYELILAVLETEGEGE